MKTAVVLFNLGGPDAPGSVKPFLFNLFNDAAILRVPQPMRWLLAKLISSKRHKAAAANYALLGGKSPLLDNTKAQAAALESALGADYKVFIAMRYWHPFAAETVAAVQAWGAERLVLLPLYPQFSTTTTASSFADWDRAAAKAGLTLPTIRHCCYPEQNGWIDAVVRQIQEHNLDYATTRLLFSAHGLPQKIVDAGDPYAWQIAQTVQVIVQQLNVPNLDHQICYQSRVGPMKWLEPSTEQALAKAAAAHKAVAVIPIAFVSEHSETLVELDVEYKHLADELGITGYVRVGTVATHPTFIEGQASLVRQDKASPRLCPAGMCCGNALGGDKCSQ